MKYIGVPKCPYCKKGVNLIRVWSVKKHGEYMCPRCKGISNIYLSPLTYVFAVLAVAAGILVYFFHKFIIDSINIMTSVYVFIPFALFFVVSLFMVYFEKPVIKKIRKTADGRFFDQNGNEMKMKMGKLVTAAGISQLQDIPPSVNQRLQRPAVQQNQGEARRPQPPQTRAANENAIGDNEDLYAATAEKLGRNFTREFSKDELETQMNSKKSVADTPRPAQRLMEEEALRRRKQAIIEQAEKKRAQVQPPDVRPMAQPVAQSTPAVRPMAQSVAQSTPAVRPMAQPVAQSTPAVRPMAQRVAQAEPEKQGSPAKELPRTPRVAPKSDFEDLIAEYDRAAGKGSTLPTEKSVEKKVETERKSNSFRQI